MGHHVGGARVEVVGLLKCSPFLLVRVYHCSNNGAELYMVLDGHDGTNACDFVKEFLPDDLFNRLGGISSSRPEEVRRAIHDSFLETEKKYFLSLDHILTQKLTLQFELGVC